MLLQKLIDKQAELGQNDQEFADFIGIPRSTWQLTRTQVKPLGRRVAAAVANKFADLKPLAVSFLLSEATPVADCDRPVA